MSKSVRDLMRTNEIPPGFVDYCMGYSEVMTIEGLRQKSSSIPPDILRQAISELYVLHRVVGGENATLEFVQYILELAPNAVNEVDDGGWAGNVHPHGAGSLPLHIACFNADCPVAVISCLLEKNPSAMKHVWSRRGLPLHCYLERALEHEALGEDTDNGWEERFPSFPTGELDYDTVKMLVEAHPDALTDVSSVEGTPLRLLCHGFGVSLELVELLSDQEHACLKLPPHRESSSYFPEEEEEADFNFDVPIINLLENNLVTPFPTDAFRYLMAHHPSPIISWIAKRQESYQDNSDDDALFFSSVSGLASNRTPLHMACSNRNITLEAVQLILEACPDMPKEECKSDGFIPIHNLCKNANLDDNTSLAVLKLLIQEYPESVEKRVNAEGMPFFRRHGDHLPIHLACVHKAFDFCKFLFERNPASASEKALHHSHIFKSRGSRVLPLHLACRYGTLELVEYLLEKRPRDIRRQTSDENYKYDEAVGRNELVRVDDRNSSLLQRGHYPLHLAASRKNSVDKTEIISLLLKQEPALVSKAGKWGNLPLHCACLYLGSPGMDTIDKLFLANHAAIHKKNIFGQFPVHLAVRSCDEEGLDALAFLAKQLPYALGELDSRGLSCAHYACTSPEPLKKLEMIRDIWPEALRSQSAQHGLPIHYACMNGCDLQVVQYLARELPESLDEHIQSTYLGQPIGLPLHCAIYRNRNDNDPDDFDYERCGRHRAIFDFLLHERYKACIEGGMPRFHALLLDDKIHDIDRIISQFSLLEMTTEDRLGRLPVHLVFGATRNDEILERMLDYTHSKQDANGWLPLHYAMRHNASRDITSFIMQQHPEHARVTDHKGATPLHIACQYGCSLETIKVLVGNDGDLMKEKDSKGCIPLHAACEGSASLSVIDYLSAGGNGDAFAVQDNDGDLPLHKACRVGNLQVIEHLIQRDKSSVSSANHHEQLPITLLCDRSGKSIGILESEQYTQAVFKLFRACPATAHQMMSLN